MKSVTVTSLKILSPVPRARRLSATPLARAVSAALLAGMAATSFADITSGNVSTVYLNPFSASGKTITSFHWASNNDLYWQEGDSNWAQEMKVHQFDGTNLNTIYTSASYAGNWVLSQGNNIYFDNGSVMGLFKYDTVLGGAPTQVFQQQNAWGYTIHNGGLFISGSDQNWDARLYYVALDQNGVPQGSVVDLGLMGSPSGPIAFDAQGNLYYASGYSTGKIHKYTSAEVSAAITGTPLTNPAGHVFIDFNSFGFPGATGMAFDSNGHLVVSLTNFGSPSDLVTFYTDDTGNYLGQAEVTAESDMGMGSVRLHQGNIQFNDGDGVYQVIPGTNTDGDRYPNSIDSDDDNDGVPDVSDAFPLNPAESVDTDNDGIGNNADGDDDNDGTPDAVDAEPLNSTNAQEIVLPLNGTFKGSRILDNGSVM